MAAPLPAEVYSPGPDLSRQVPWRLQSQARTAVGAGTWRAARRWCRGAGSPSERGVGTEGRRGSRARGPTSPGWPQFHLTHSLSELERADGLPEIFSPRGDLQERALIHSPGEQYFRPAAAQGPTCSSSTAVVPAPSAGCSRRVSCESRKGTCGRRARSAAITPPSASKERLIDWASRRRRAPLGSLCRGLTTPAFHTRSDPARSTRCSVPAGANETHAEGDL